MAQNSNRFLKEAQTFQKLTDSFTLANGLEIPNLGFGTWKMPNDEVGVRSVKKALEVGYRHIDTAAVYGNEEAVGQGMKESGVPREDIFLTTKLWNTEHGYEKTLKAFGESTKKLGTDYVDLYLIHWPNPVDFRDNWEEANAGSWRAFEELYEAGKVKSIGVSNFHRHHLKELEKTWNIVPMVNQIYICPGSFPTELVDYCVDKDILLESYSPLGHGEIFGIKEIQDLAKEVDRPIAQVVLRWHLQKGLLALPKSVHADYIEENAGIYDFELTPEQMRVIDKVGPDVCGARTNPDTIDY